MRRKILVLLCKLSLPNRKLPELARDKLPYWSSVKAGVMGVPGRVIVIEKTIAPGAWGGWELLR
jgi:hypothetical protein